MIVANKWYNIAQTTTIGSSSGVRIEFEQYRIILNTSVNWGNATISIQSTNISNDIIASVRLRNNGAYYYLDIKVNQPLSSDYAITLFDNIGWIEVLTVSDSSGITICSINDINSLKPDLGSGDSFFSEDGTNNVYLKTKIDGSKRDLYNINKLKSDVLVIPNGEGVEGEWHLEVGKLGQGVETPESGAGNISNLSIKIGASYFDINEVEENVIVLPEYPTLPNLDEYATIEWVRDNYALSSDVYNKTIIDTKFTEYLELFSGYLKTEGGTITNDLFVRGKLSMGTLVIPNGEGVEGEWTLEVGALGEGADTPSAGGGSADSVDWSAILNKPTTLSGYGITDALPITGGTMQGDITLPSGFYMRTGNSANYAMFGVGGDKILVGTPDYTLALRTYTDATINDAPILHSGNYSDYALPLSGGTITGRVTFKDSNRLAFNGSIIEINKYNGTDVEVWLRGSANNLELYDGVTWHKTIHSGNIGSQSVASANILAKVYVNENINYGRDNIAMRMIQGTASNSVSLGYPRQYVSGLSVITGYTGWQMVSYGGSSLPNPYFRQQIDDGSWLDWKQLAFLTDNVASATKLQTARTIWGQSFDGTGNVNGDLDMRYSKITFAESANDYHIGWGSDNMFVYKNYYGHYFITNDTERMRITGSGNILIGTTTDDVEARLLVEGSILGRSTSYSSTIIPSISGLRVGTRGAGHNGYNTGIAFNALNYPPYYNHIHAWIGLGSYTTTEAAECYPLVFATNGSPNTNTPPTERMRIMPNGNTLIGSTEDRGNILAVKAYRNHSQSLGYFSEGVHFGNIAEGYGTYFWTEGSGNGFIQQGRNDGDATAYNLCIQTLGGNVLIGTTSDWGYKLDVNGSTKLMSVVTEFNDEINRYGGDLYLQHRGSIAGSQGDARTSGIIMCANGGTVRVGDTVDNGDKLQVMGSLRVTRAGDRGSYLNITVSDVQVQYNGWDTGDGNVFHDFFSNGNQIARIDGFSNKVIAYGSMQTPYIHLYGGLSNSSSISTISNYLSFNSIGNEICVSGNDNSVLYINYRPSHAGFAPTIWRWNAGSSTSWAQMEMGNIISHGNISADGLEIPQAPPSNPQSGKWYLYIG